MEHNQENITFNNRIDLQQVNHNIQLIKQEISKVLVGQEHVLDLILTAILANGHVLIQGVPGVAKTLTAKLIAQTLKVQYSRIQFTPDLMPSDVLGVSIYNNQSQQFEYKKGPIFSNIVLIDEINRAPAKTQSALFEVMEERQVTMDGHRYILDKPFIVIATQNPIEHEGTYRLPEAQLDRFLFLIPIQYPSLADEITILEKEHQLQHENKISLAQSVIEQKDIIALQSIIQQIIVEPKLIHYIAEVIQATRKHPYLYLGASPRASIAILKSAKAYAAINGRDYVIPEDIYYVTPFVLEHRIQVTPEREMEGITTQKIIKEIIQKIEIPR